MRTLLRFVVFVLALWLPLGAFQFGCSSDSTSEPLVQTQQVTLASLAVTPKGVTVTKGATVQFAAIGTYSDATLKDLTAAVTWASSDPAVAKISNDAASKGLATGVTKGSVTVTALVQEGSVTITGGTSLVVSDVAMKSIAVTPAKPVLAKGTELQLVATGTFEDNTTQDLTSSATWTSSKPDLASVSDEPATKGLATGIDPGSATITASFGGLSATATLTVTGAVLTEIDVTSPDPWVAKGMNEQFKATGIFSDDTVQDLTRQVIWASSDPSVTISNAAATKGLAMAMAEGSATISATLLGVVGTRQFEVTAAKLATIDVTPKGAAIAKGTTTQFKATGILSDHSFQDLTRFVIWSSSNEAIAKVGTSDAATKGFVTGVAAGAADISARFGSVTGSASVVITAATMDKVEIVPLNPVVPKGLRQWFLAIGTFSDGSAQDVTDSATWGSSESSLANVSNVPGLHGMVTTIKEGATVISASLVGKSASTTLTVTASTLSSIAVTPTNPLLAKGTSTALTATGTYSDSTTQDLTALVTWSSSNTSASVSNAQGYRGIVTGLAQGTATISAKLGAVGGSTLVTVTAASLSSIAVTPTNTTIAKGTRAELMATGSYTDQTTQDLTAVVTWSSSDASVAVSNDVASHGFAVGMVEGSAKVTATYGGKSGSTTVTVTAATLVSLEISPIAPVIANGSRVNFTAVGVYTDNAKQDLTEVASWASSDQSVAFVYNKPYWQGIAFGVGQGSATITASYGGSSTSTTITVTAAKIVELVITPDKAAIAKGTTLWFSATAKYTDATEQDVTTSVTWASSDLSKVILSNAYGSKGLASGVAEGAVTISAAYAGKTASTTLTVTAASLSSIEVLPSNATMDKETTLQFMAIGTYSDASTQVITGNVTWTSSNSTIAITSNAYGSKGLVTAVSVGTTTITATLPSSGKKGSAPLTVK